MTKHLEENVTFVINSHNTQISKPLITIVVYTQVYSNFGRILRAYFYSSLLELATSSTEQC